MLYSMMDNSRVLIYFLFRCDGVKLVEKGMDIKMNRIRGKLGCLAKMEQEIMEASVNKKSFGLVKIQ